MGISALLYTIKLHTAFLATVYKKDDISFHQAKVVGSLMDTIAGLTKNVKYLSFIWGSRNVEVVLFIYFIVFRKSGSWTVWGLAQSLGHVLCHVGLTMGF